MSVYDRVLRLRHLRLAGWQRESLTWGSFVLAVLLALTGLVSPWGIVVLPVALALVVKGHDLLVGRLAATAERFVPADLPRPGRAEIDETRSARNSNEPPVPKTEGSSRST